MSTTTEPTFIARDLGDSIFERVLVGIDGSPESLEAAMQAAKLATGPVCLVASYDLAQAVVGAGMMPGPVYLDELPLREQAHEALEEANREISPTPVTAQIGRGRSWATLLDQIEEGHHTLVAVGSHGAGRAKGIVIGSTATELIHKAPCSVLIARKPMQDFPSSIVVGVDGSPESAAAEVVAGRLSERFDAKLARYENVPNSVSTLVDAAIEADLLVVGSRGLHGLKALGSVSERAAHEAKCSVLIVR
jgi:nucleotide-binding universal stress UspA family protein